ncbi:MAG TPA: ABC transporter permease [Bryobacteraceae bacterium]|nr:ABC transporter permease [Bryobacteraceae bacterium]
MRLLRGWMRRAAGLLPNARREQELADELNAHLAMHIDDNLRRGMSVEDARRDAVLTLGGIEPTKQLYRERRTVPFLENLMQDVRFAVRQLRKNPGFTATAVFMLALGMSASVAIFVFVDAALIKPLPYRDPARLIVVYETAQPCLQCPLSYLDFLDWKKLNTGFQSMDAFRYANITVSVPEGAESAESFRVTSGFFRTLGVAPLLGRDFYDGEDSLAAPHTVMLSYSAWKQRYGGKPDVLGKTVTLDGDPRIIIGVLAPEFHFASTAAEFWTPFYPGGGCNSRRNCRAAYVIGRLKDGVSIETALANVKLIAGQLEKQYPDSNRGYGAMLLTLSKSMVGDIRPVLFLLLAGAGLLLLIASVNVASLMLVRSESRKREIAVRSALGASRARIAAQFAAEGLVLAAAGTALGLAMASWATHILASLIPAEKMIWMPFLKGIGLNVRVLGFSGAIALVASVLFSLTPSLHFSLSKTGGGIAEGTRGSSGRTWRRLGSKLVVVELSTAVVLLVGAGLLGKSLYALLHVELGLRPDHVVTIEMAAPQSYAASNEKAIALEGRIINRMKNLPGVKSVAISDLLPGLYWSGDVWVVVAGKPAPHVHNSVGERTASSGYFTTLGAKLARGRYFTEAEDVSKPPIAIVNESFAKKYFPGEDPIGKQVAYERTGPQVPMQIVGVVEDVRERQLDLPSYPVLYVPFVDYVGTYFYILARTSGDATPLLAALPSAIHQIDPNIATKDAAILTGLINDSQSAYMHRSSAWLAGGFAALALLLSVVGLYGVVAYSVSQRTREIGIRMALGAQRGSVYGLILKEAGWLTAAGIGIGLACSVGAAMSMRGLLFGVRSWDLETLAGVALVLGISAFFASYIPARRAASVNPVDTLHTE